MGEGGAQRRMRGLHPRIEPLTRLRCAKPPSPTGGEGKNRYELSLPLTFDTPLPIDAVLDELARTLAGHNAAVLVAPPGAGKTTRVPLALLDEPWTGAKKIIVLEP